MARILFTCRPLSGHFHPLLPLAEAARSAGHVVGLRVRRPGRGSGSLTRASRPSGRDHPTPSVPSGPRSSPASGRSSVTTQRAFFFTEIFAGLELVARDRRPRSGRGATGGPTWCSTRWPSSPRRWCARRLGVTYVDVGFGPLVPGAVLDAAGSAAAPHWQAHGPGAGAARRALPPPLRRSVPAGPAEPRDRRRSPRYRCSRCVRPVARPAPSSRPTWARRAPGRAGRVRHHGHGLERRPATSSA